MTRSQLGIATATIEDPSGMIHAVWFKKTNPRYDVFSSLRQNLQVGNPFLYLGPIEWGPGGRQIRSRMSPFAPRRGQRLEGDDIFHFDRLVPAYTTPETIHERFFRDDHRPRPGLASRTSGAHVAGRA